MAATTASPEAGTKRDDGELEKLILFRVGGETFALPILQAREVVSGFALTRVPTLPAAYCGVVGVRGSAIPVVDLRHRLFGEETLRGERDARVIVLDLEPAPVGLLVDAVARVSAFARQRRTAVPRGSGSVPSHVLSAMVEMEEGKFALLLDAPSLVEEIERGVPAAELPVDAAIAPSVAGREPADMPPSATPVGSNPAEPPLSDAAGDAIDAIDERAETRTRA